MSDWPVLYGPETFGQPAIVNSQTSAGHASAHTKGNWAELVAVTKFNAEYILIGKRTSTMSRTYLVDIGIGPAGSETVIVSNLLMSSPAAYEWAAMGYALIPIKIPKGHRLAVRHQATAGASNIQIAASLAGGGFLSRGGLSGVVTYGVDTATSVGTQIDPGIAPWTLGAWVQVVASLSRDIKGFFIAVCKRSRTSTHALFQMYVGLGAVGSEVSIAPYHICGTAYTNSDISIPFSMFYPISIKAGSRISIAGYSSTNSNPQRLFDCAFYGVY